MKLENIHIKTARIEISLNCQLSCKACPNANGLITKKLKRGDLSLDNFIKFIELNKNVIKIELSNWGEPFLNKDFLSILEYANYKNIELNIDNGANLNYVDDNVLEGIVKYKLNRLSCSIDGASDKVYRKYRNGGNLQIVLKNIKIINEYKKYYNSEFPQLSWQFIVFGHNQHEVKSAEKLAKKYNMNFNLRLNWKSDYSPADPMGNVSVVSREQFYEKYKQNYKREICTQLWKNPQINWDGKILGCCNNYWQPFDGNAFENDMLTLLNLPEIEYSRSMLLGTASPKLDNPCSNCKKYFDLKKDNNWLTINEVYKSF